MGFVNKYIEYLKDNPEHYWFRRKIWGWGWTPARWQGWLVLGLYLAAVFFFAFTIDESSPPREVAFTFLIPIAILTALLIRICYRTGEPPKWQWGFPDKKE